MTAESALRTLVDRLESQKAEVLARGELASDSSAYIEAGGLAEAIDAARDMLQEIEGGQG